MADSTSKKPNILLPEGFELVKTKDKDEWTVAKKKPKETPEPSWIWPLLIVFGPMMICLVMRL